MSFLNFLVLKNLPFETSRCTFISTLHYRFCSSVLFILYFATCNNNCSTSGSFVHFHFLLSRSLKQTSSGSSNFTRLSTIDYLTIISSWFQGSAAVNLVRQELLRSCQTLCISHKAHLHYQSVQFSVSQGLKLTFALGHAWLMSSLINRIVWKLILPIGMSRQTNPRWKCSGCRRRKLSKLKTFGLKTFEMEIRSVLWTKLLADWLCRIILLTARFLLKDIFFPSIDSDKQFDMVVDPASSSVVPFFCNANGINQRLGLSKLEYISVLWPLIRLYFLAGSKTSPN